MKITVVGGGNIGTQFAVHSAGKGHSVKMFTSNPDRFAKRLFIVDKSGEVIKEGEIVLATSDPNEAFHDAEMIMITMPPTMMIPLAQIIYEHADPHAIIGFVPGNGGFEFAFRDCIERGNVLFVAALPPGRTEECAALIESIYDIPCVRLPGFMALTLTPSNPILHTARLMTIFRDYEPGVTYDSLPLFYEEWDDASSELLLACDDEIQEICKALPGFGLEYVVSEREFYNADTVEEMTNAICTEESLLGLTTPSVRSDAYDVLGRGLSGFRRRRRQRWQRIEQHTQRRIRWREKLEERRRHDRNTEGLIPDLHSRYFTADFPYGLSVIHQIGKIAGVSMPNIDRLIDWYDKIAIINDKLYLTDYGIEDLDDLKEFYQKGSWNK